MSSRRFATLVVAGVGLAGAPAAEAAAPVAESAALPKAKFRLASMTAPPQTVRAGGAFRARGRVRNLPGRRGGTARLTFTLRTDRAARRGRTLRALTVKRTEQGRSRRFNARVRIPARVAPGRYALFACVRRGRAKASCKSYSLRVTARPKAPTPPASPGANPPGANPPGANPPGAGSPDPGKAPACAGKGPVGFEVYRRLDELPLLTCGVETKQFSGFDRRGQNQDGFSGEFSCLRPQTQGEPCLLAETQGAGEVQSIWFTRNTNGVEGDVSGTGNLTVELDGRRVIDDVPLQDIVDGELGAPFEFPLVANADQSSGGVYLKVPMPYRESMRVTTTVNPQFYHVSHRQFADAEGVRTFDPADRAGDVVALMKDYGTKDPKPAQPGARTVDDDFALAPGETTTLAGFDGPGMISQLRLRIPQIVGTPAREIRDDGRSFGAGGATNEHSEYTAAIDPANQGVRLTRRFDSGIGNQRADIYVEGVSGPVGRWPGTPPNGRGGEWADEVVELPASVTAGKSEIRIRNAFVSSQLDFNEFTYWIDSRVDGEYRRTDTMDLGPDHLGEEAAHDYEIVGQDFQGARTFEYPQSAAEREAEAARVAPSDAVLRDARLRITFDGERTVDAPLGEFFGSGLGEYPVRSLFSAMQTAGDGSYFAWWPMPFRGGARVELYNGSDVAIEAGDASVTASRDGRWADRLEQTGDAGYFRATANAGRTVPGRDWTFLDTAGRGKFVGVHHTMRGLTSGAGGAFNGIRGYLEGDERVHVDGSRTPQMHGTGSEDFYEAGWYFNRGAFSNPVNGNTTHEQRRAGCELSCDSTYRLMVGDAVPFESRLRFSMEHGPENDEAGIYGSTAFSYQQRDAALQRSDALDVGDPESEAAHGYAAPGSSDPEALTSYFEGDDDTVEYTDEGRSTAGPVSFAVRVDEGNRGVRLRRLSDQGRSYQSARVRVDGRDVGLWRQPLGNPYKRWLHDTFELPASATEGKRELRIELVPATDRGSPPWNAARYEAFAHVAAFGDRQAPGGVPGIRANGGDGDVRITWKPAADETGVDYYEVYGTDDRGSTIGPETLLGRTRTEGFSDTGLSPRQTRYYRVRAVDAAGNLGPASDEVRATTSDVVRIEAETLLPARDASDLVDRQSNCCGIRWSADAQLWFHSDAVDDTFTVDLDVPRAGTYDLSMLHTKACDYGTHALEVDGVRVGPPFAGYARDLSIGNEHDYGEVLLEQGPNALRFKVTGKDPQACGPSAFVGVDAVTLRFLGG